MLNVLKIRNSYKARTILNLPTSNGLKNLPCQKEEFQTTETFPAVGSTYCLQNERYRDNINMLHDRMSTKPYAVDQTVISSTKFQISGSLKGRFFFPK